MKITLGVTGHQSLEDETAWEWVEAKINTILEEHPSAQGVSSLAKGADQLFARILLEQQMKLTVVVPCVDYADTFDAITIKNYRTLLAQATKKLQLNFISPSEKAFDAAGKKVAELSDILIAVWDGQPAKGLGGTGDIVKYAEKRHKDIIHINPMSREVVYIYGD